MATMLISHEYCLRHNTGIGHPEQVDRLLTVFGALRTPEFENLVRIEAPRATGETVALVHTRPYIEKTFGLMPKQGFWNLDPDTVVSSGSGEAALRAVGAVCRAVDGVMSGEARNAFCAVRPPGHHAGRDHAGGFCLFNNVAIGAVWARQKFGVQRVAIVDFDVHHGDGTQSIFWDDAEALFVSMHQWPFDPWSGAVSDIGACGNILNLPLREGIGSAEYRQCFVDQVLPRLRLFEPEMLLVSAGFDAHQGDPIGGLNLGADDYHWLGRRLVEVAEETCQGRLVTVLEGGYDLQVPEKSVAGFVRALSGLPVESSS